MFDSSLYYLNVFCDFCQITVHRIKIAFTMQSKLNERNLTREREKEKMRVDFIDQQRRWHRSRNQAIAFISFFVQVKWKHGEKSPTCAKIQEKGFSVRSLFSSRISLIRKKDGSLIQKTRSMERKLAGSNAKLAFAMKITFVSRGRFYPVDDRGKNSSRIFDNALTDFEERALYRWTGRNVI